MNPAAKEKNGGITIPRWALWVAAAVLIPGVGVVVRQEVRLAAIEANRYNSGDHAEHLEEINRRFREEVPPPEVERRLQEHERRLERLENR